MNYKFKKGDRVNFHPKKQNGIIKSLTSYRDEPAYFVVYECGGRWGEYEYFTGAHTLERSLHEGWAPRKAEVRSIIPSACTCGQLDHSDCGGPFLGYVLLHDGETATFEAPKKKSNGGLTRGCIVSVNNNNEII